MYENKFPTGYLNDYKPNVTKSGTTYIVDYEIGECVYTYQRMGKRIKQEVLQLIKCDMWKVISELNEKSPLSDGDYQGLNMEIRNHSLQYVTNFINGQVHHP